MPDYINREDLLDFLTMIPIDLGYREVEDIEKYINAMPAADVVSKKLYDQIVWERDVAISQFTDIGKGLGEKMDDVVERKTGKWIDEGFYADGHGAHAYRCSNCDGHIIEYEPDPFCKWCGAQMGGEEDV